MAIGEMMEGLSGAWQTVVLGNPLKADCAPESRAEQGQAKNLQEIPDLVLYQLRRAGFVPEWCSESFLRAAREGAAVDCEVFDDPDGDNFLDDLVLTDREKQAKSIIHPDFRDSLAAERDKCRQPGEMEETRQCA